MKLTVISWNIRHLRYDKVKEHSKKIRVGLAGGHVAFLYENKMSHNDNIEMYEKLVSIVGKAHGDDVQVRALNIPVGTNEYVVVVYTEMRKVGDGSVNFTKGDEVQIDVSHNQVYDDRLWDKGWDALRASYNVTVRSEIQAQRVRHKFGYRIPAVVDVVVTKPDFTQRKFRIAAWHAPGPAKGTGPALFQAYGEVLADHIDLFVGDFNYNPKGSFAPPKILKDTLQWYKVRGSTTVREDGRATSHSAGPDLVYYNVDKLVAYGGNVGLGSCLIGDIAIGQEDTDLADDLYSLTDHLPVVVSLKRL